MKTVFRSTQQRQNINHFGKKWKALKICATGMNCTVPTSLAQRLSESFICIQPPTVTPSGMIIRTFGIYTDLSPKQPKLDKRDSQKVLLSPGRQRLCKLCSEPVKCTMFAAWCRVLGRRTGN